MLRNIRLLFRPRTWIDTILWYQPKYSKKIAVIWEQVERGEEVEAQGGFRRLFDKNFIHTTIKTQAGKSLLEVCMMLDDYDEVEKILDERHLDMVLFQSGLIFDEKPIRARIAKFRGDLSIAIELYGDLWSNAVCWEGPIDVYNYGYQQLTTMVTELRQLENVSEQAKKLVDFDKAVSTLKQDLEDTEELFNYEMCIVHQEILGFYVCQQWDEVVKREQEINRIRNRYDDDFEPLIKSVVMINSARLSKIDDKDNQINEGGAL